MKHRPNAPANHGKSAAPAERDYRLRASEGSELLAYQSAQPADAALPDRPRDRSIHDHVVSIMQLQLIVRHAWPPDAECTKKTGGRTLRGRLPTNFIAYILKAYSESLLTRTHYAHQRNLHGQSCEAHSGHFGIRYFFVDMEGTVV